MMNAELRWAFRPTPLELLDGWDLPGLTGPLGRMLAESQVGIQHGIR